MTTSDLINRMAEFMTLGNQDRKTDYIFNAYGDDVRTDGYGNIYINRDFATRKPYVVAHIDTVDDREVDKDIVIFENDHSGAPDEMIAEREGIQCNMGADDGVGVAIALKIFEEIDVGVCLFRDEEIGCQGSSASKVEHYKNASYMIQIDRKNAGDLINIGSGTRIASENFVQDAQPVMDKYNYKATCGGLTDVVALQESEKVSVACINVSCGYYNPHMDNEYVVLPEAHNCYKFVSSLIQHLGSAIYPHVGWNALKTGELASMFQKTSVSPMPNSSYVDSPYFDMTLREEIEEVLDVCYGNDQELADEIRGILYSHGY